MNIKITSLNLVLGDEVKDYAEKKVSALGKFIDGSNDALCRIELAKTTNHHKSGEIYKAEADMTVLGKQYFVVAEASDMYAAIDQMRDELERVIVSKRQRYTTMMRRGAGRIKNLIKRFYS